jgi:hypothetical protein
MTQRTWMWIGAVIVVILAIWLFMGSEEATPPVTEAPAPTTAPAADAPAADAPATAPATDAPATAPATEPAAPATEPAAPAN